MFSQKIEYSGGVFFWPLTPLFSFVSFHLKGKEITQAGAYNKGTYQTGEQED